MPAKRMVSGMIRADTYAIVSRAVEEGLRYGWRRAHKHVEAPDEEQMVDAMSQAVLNSLCEVLRFDGGKDA